VYVVPGSNAEAHVQKRYPHKTVRQMPSSLRPQNIASLLNGMPLSFQRHAAGEQGVSEQDAPQKGMGEKSREFVEKGGEICAKG
jgi:hypothetical protein